MNTKIYNDEKFINYLNEYFSENLPDKIYDAHFHISPGYAKRCGFEGREFEQYRDFTEKYLGRELDGGLMMAAPALSPTIDKDNEFNLNLAKEYNFDAGLIVDPQYGREKAEKMIDAYPEIKLLKPYLSYTPTDDPLECDIVDFAPEWMWELAHEREMPILVHLSHYQDMLYDENNIRDIRYMCKKYPKAKLILAHCAMGHNVTKLKLGIEYIKEFDNIWFDCSGSTEALSIYCCIKNFGVEKMMYGGDFNHAANLGRICSFGSNFAGFHPGFVKQEVFEGAPYKYQPLNNLQEGLIALFQAVELLELGKKDIQKIFFNNAKELFS